MNRSPKVCSWSLLLSLLMLVPSAGARAQDELAPVIETLDVHVVNVDVVVTDRSGEVVRGLTRDDFELFEDGKPVAITNFAWIERTPAPAEETGAGEMAVEVPAEPPVPPQPLHLVVYVDNRNLQPRNRNRLLPAVERFLETRLAPGDQVMLVRSDTSLAVLQPFTTEREPVLAALKPLRKATSRAMLAESEARRVASDLLNADDNSGEDARVQAEMFREAERNQALASLDTLTRFLQSFAGLPGRKAVLLISDGVAMTDRAQNALKRVTDTANSGDVTFYTLDGVGTETAGDTNAASVASGIERSLTGTLTVNRRRSLEALADDTGGVAVSGTSNFDRGLERIAQGLDSSYSLGFDPRRERDGGYHKLKVKVKGSGLTVRHRDGYLDKPTVERLADRTLAALSFATALDNPLGVAVQKIPGAGDDWVVALPVASLTLVPQRKAQHGQVRLLIASLGPAGELRPVRGVELPIKIPIGKTNADTPPAIGYKVSLEPGVTRIVVGAQDLLSSTQSFARVDL
ncbi:MAG: VWA domain-containing protein [Acidobacteria bacterium]|nr:VWA domain-containing protein [Acidobacteriota bacterium]